MRRQRLLAGAVASLLTVTLAACGNATSVEDTQATAQEAAPVEESADASDAATNPVDPYVGKTMAEVPMRVETEDGTAVDLASIADGKPLVANFWATWCPPCRKEMPYIQEIYEEAMEDDDTDLVILSVAAPDQGRETSEKGIRSFLGENGYTYPVLMDYDGEVSDAYYIRSYPTTFMIDTRGNIYGYVPGAMTKEIMEEIIRQTRGVSENRPR